CKLKVFVVNEARDGAPVPVSSSAPTRSLTSNHLPTAQSPPKVGYSPAQLPAMTTADIIRVDRPTTSSKLFAHTRWDAIPVLASLFHLGYFLGLFFLYP